VTETFLDHLRLDFACDLGLRSSRRSQRLALRTRASLTVVSKSAAGPVSVLISVQLDRFHAMPAWTGALV
jgi:hypothetical protein